MNPRAGMHLPAGRQGCSKVRFASRFDADDAVLSARIQRVLHRSTRRREQRSYYCSRCTGWHLTSQPLNLGVWHESA